MSTQLESIGGELFINGRKVVTEGLGGATAWARVAGNGTVLDSYNIGSVTRTASGVYDVVFATPMDNANYAISGSGEVRSSASYIIVENTGTRTVNGFTMLMVDGAFLVIDPTSFSLVIHGGKN